MGFNFNLYCYQQQKVTEYINSSTVQVFVIYLGISKYFILPLYYISEVICTDKLHYIHLTTVVTNLIKYNTKPLTKNCMYLGPLVTGFKYLWVFSISAKGWFPLWTSQIVSFIWLQIWTVKVFLSCPICPHLTLWPFVGDRP